MKKFFISLAVFVMAFCANAQTNQYFWYNGNLMMGNPIAQIDSVTFGEGEPADTLHILLPRTIIKEVHDTVYITIHDTVCPNDIPEGALNGLFSVSTTEKLYMFICYLLAKVIYLFDYDMFLVINIFISVKN